MENKNAVFYGNREEWLQSKKYLFDDIYSDEFAIDFQIRTIEEWIELGVDITEPEFKEVIIDEGPF